MLTDAFYRSAAAGWSGRSETPPTFVIAVGAGDAGWDDAPPPPEREVRDLVREVARLEVPPEGVAFLDAEGRRSEEPTPVVRLAAVFGPDEAVGTLRECGLWVEAGGEPALVAYYVHPRLDKAPGTRLERAVRIDLTPRRVAAGRRETRWLGNSRERELHDLEALAPQCQVDQIAVDRRFYFGSVEEALQAGYDRCAYCFDRELSER